VNTIIVLVSIVLTAAWVVGVVFAGLLLAGGV
jgi:hypothetical protein